ncbi:hypothetical protein Ga0074812_13244 [Parafrankia irregularis]|uniref:Uncharacterized protein n=1 Tax=Parafrankia irregularis TaxID=795642 RepID=A0A0S4QXH1_9ACTN|nr:MULTISPECIES: hypothetical protein [Parafrankia]MBE3202582.1 hypothetical protein [Parafrankia sp. CH37]CUU59839.1 hypothetical protein Ga0074812_13244 [Parafrankia irregularis]
MSGSGGRLRSSARARLVRIGSTAVAGVLTVGALAGCASGSPSPASAPGRGTSAVPHSRPLPAAAVPSYDPKKGARTDVVAGSCDRDNGAWPFGGLVRNQGSQPRAYRIVVDFVTDDSTVVDTKVVEVPDVPAGASTDWSVAGAADGEDLRCVIRNVQFD